MASSLIIVGLAAAWLVVLVPMVARKRQVITQTNDAALAARVVRRGSARGASDEQFGRGESGVATVADEDGFSEPDLLDAEAGPDEDPDWLSDHGTHGAEVDTSGDHLAVEGAGEVPGQTSVSEHAVVTEQRQRRRYRPGRGGFDPEAAALVASAKYAFRQRVVVVLLFAVVATAVAAGVVLPLLWWAHGVTDVVLVGYLVYLRRQVRIEEEIRQRRLARLRAASRRTPRRSDPLADIEVLKNEPADAVGSERKPMPTSRVRRQAVIVDLEDEDPAFHELDDPGRLTYRRAAGE